MENYLLLKNIKHAVIALILGIIISFTSIVYIAIRIYVPGYSLVIPIIIMIIGLGLVGWSSYRIAVLGRDHEI